MTKERPGYPRKDLATHTKAGTPRKLARPRKVDPMRWAAAYVEAGHNAAEASRRTRGTASISPNYSKVHGSYMLKKPEVQSAIQILEARMEKTAMKAVERLDQLVDSQDENIATRNAHYVIDQVKGKAVSRNLNANFDIQAAVDELIL